MTRHCRIVFIIFITLFFTGKIIAQKKEMIWLVPDFPPFYITSGPYKGEGSLNFLKKEIQTHFKEYNHISMVANSKRIFHQLKSQDMVLYPAALKTREREKHVLYSIPYTVVLPNNLITLGKNITLIKPYIRNGKFDLEKALKEEKFSIGYSIGRVYGKIINKILFKHRKSSKLKVYYADFFKSAFVDLIHENLDCAIGYPQESNYFLKLLNRDEKIFTIPFKGEKNFVIGFFVFPKTKWGEKTRKRINVLLKKERTNRKFHRKFEEWMDSRNIKLYRNYLSELLND